MLPLHVGLDIVNLALAISTVSVMAPHYNICHFQFLKANSGSFILIQ